jgi:hypothetical protein
MMGLTSSTYWLITWIFWSAMYLLFLGILDLMTIVMVLPDGYQIGWFVKSEASLVFVFFILSSQHTVAFGFLLTALWGSYKGAERNAFHFCFFLIAVLPQILNQLVRRGAQKHFLVSARMRSAGTN